MTALSHETPLICSSCRAGHTRAGQRHCAVCHADYMRNWRKLVRAENQRLQRRVVKLERQLERRA